jgi:hypothetical protein
VRSAGLVLAPEKFWEGTYRPIAPSRPSPSRKREHALRDPAIFVEGPTVYLLYAVSGEAGIAIAVLPPIGASAGR